MYVERTKYLGVTLDSKLKWYEHINSVVKKGNSVYGFLKQNLRNCPAAVCMNIQYIGVLMYCHAKVDEYPCVLLNASVAVMPRSIIPSLLRHSAMYPLCNLCSKESLRNEIAPQCLPHMQAARSCHHGNVERQLRITKASASQGGIC